MAAASSMPSSDRALPMRRGARAFLVWFAATAMLGIVLLATVAMLADPRGIFAYRWPGAPRLCGPGLYIGARDAKPILPRLHPARQALFGTSRVMLGFAEADADALLGRDTLNLGIEAAQMGEVALLFEEAAAGGTLKRAWVGLDFSMFAGRGDVRIERPLDLPQPLFNLRYGIADPAVLRHAAGRLLRGCASDFTLRGFSLPKARMDRPPPEEAAAGQAGAWRARDREGPITARASYRAQLAQLRTLARSARRRGIQLVLFVAPSPPLLQRAVRDSGRADAHRAWQRDIEEAARAEGAELLDRRGVAPNDCISAVDPACAFVDPIHFRPMVGRRILENSLAGRAQPLAQPQSTLHGPRA